MRKCDVIIPVYNAYECLSECINSVLKNTDFKTNHLILIEDKSSDKRVLPLLKEYTRKNNKKISLIINDENLGFVKTVNRAMQFSKNDILLLNSDTVVTSGWLEDIKKCAEMDPKIATVTPLSNNASLASVPKFNQKNILPQGYDAQKMADLIREYSLHEYPEIPSGHGFCLYIKREALNEVGYFDEKDFGKGYGEENDFCFRCLEHGFSHVLCDDAYVLHKGAQSFLEKGDHGNILVEKYPKIMADTGAWYQSEAIREIGDNVALALGIVNGRQSILSLKNMNEDLIEKTRRKCDLHILEQKDKYFFVHSYFKDTDLTTAVYKKPVVFTLGYKRIIDNIRDIFGVSVVIEKDVNEIRIREACKKCSIRKKPKFDEIQKKMLEYDLVKDLFVEPVAVVYDKPNLTIPRKVYLKVRYILFKK